VRQRAAAARTQTTVATDKVATLTMRVAVISDVHGNYHALERVLAEIDAEGVDAVWCLGDTVGYGPLPNECCTAVEDRADVCLVGNHDLVVLGELTVSDFNDEAAAAALWTSEILTHASRSFLESLKPTGELDGVDLFHASARDPIWEYVLTEEAARATLELSDAPIVLVGHSHVALAITQDGNEVAGGLAGAGAKFGLEGRWLLNPGSVGQPRDGDPRAAWLLLDLEGRFAAFRRVQYPIQQTQTEIRERGLPEPLAARLERGE
jgi:predicted phosphodiesterase